MTVGKGLNVASSCAVAVLVVLLAHSVVLANRQEASLTRYPNASASVAPESPSLSLAPSTEPTPEPGAATGDGSGGMYSPDARLARPKMSDPPTQVELGHYQYWMSCMVCHGDRGQGLTDEWRSVLDPEDQNCWQSKCHAPNHPPWGFEIPRSSPAVIGEGALTDYKTASDIYEYMRVKMPWSYPGLFDDEEYWPLTAYLAQENQIDYGYKTLGPDNGEKVLWIPKLPQTHKSATGFERFAGGALVVLLASAAIVQRWTQDRS
jgi:mono/diheme cytochrome c family protein